MTDKRILCVRPDGGVSVMIPAPKGRREGEGEIEWITRISLKDGTNKGLDVKRVLPSIDVIQSRYFRNLWEWDIAGNKAVISMVKARGQRMTEIRAERDRQLDESDKERNRLADVGTAQEQQDIADKRQALRDLPAAAQVGLDALTTLDEIMRYEPAWAEAETKSTRGEYGDGPDDQQFGTNDGAEAT